MAHILFQDLDDFKKYVGGAVNQSLMLESIEPKMYMVAQTEIVPWLGSQLYDTLVTAVAAGPVDNGTPLGKLLPYVCRPLALLTMHHYANIGTVQFGESGMFRAETDDRKSAFKYQEENYRQAMLEDGYEALELMQRFLDENATDYPTWTAKIRARELVINYASELREAYSKSISRYTFEMLRSLIPDLELFALIPYIGDQQFDEIKTAIAADEDLPERMVPLLAIIRRIIGNFLVEEGIRRNWITLEGNQVVQYVQRSIDARRQKLPATVGAGSSMKIQQAEEFAQRWLSRLTYYLDSNIDDFPLYQAWKDAQAAAAETQDSERPAENNLLFTGVKPTDDRRAVHRL